MPTVGRRLLMAGRGGLNLTHSEPIGPFLARYGAGQAHLADTLARFPANALVDWANKLGIETYVGTSGRVFPREMKASPLLRAWLVRLERLGVVIKTRHTWRAFDASGLPLIEDATGQQHALPCDATLLALGGASWPRLGADGAWVPILAADGIAITPLEAANCGALITWTDFFAQKFAGTPLKRIAISIAGGEPVRGEAIVTANGLEGGAVYAIGPQIRPQLAAGYPVTIKLDLRPDQSKEELTERLETPRGKQSTATYLRKAVHLSPVAMSLLREGGPLPTDPAALAHRIKSVPLTITGLAGLERAISTAGGVAFSAVDTNAMLIARPGVFVAGEMLDWDAPTGGYLLQATFATAVQAARGMDRWLGERDGVAVAALSLTAPIGPSR
jgi:uncharacterized flavoprotein (TIGR03862 family)